MTKRISFSVLFLLTSSFLSLFLYRLVYSNSPTTSVDTKSVLISEVKPSGGSGKTTDEYIELYNSNEQAIEMSNWTLARQTKTASSANYDVLVIFPVGFIFPGHTHVLVAHTEYLGLVTPDITYTGNSIADDNSIILMDNNSHVVDLVGYGKATNIETIGAPAPTSQFLSIERLPGGIEGNGQDTGNNFLDFVRALPTPQNLSSNLTPLSVPGTSIFSSSSQPEVFETTTTVAVFTSSTDSIGGTVDPAPQLPSIPIAGSILITELLPIPSSTQTEFIELYNRTPQDISVHGWWIQDGSGSKTFLNGVIGSQNYFVVDKPKGNLNNSGDLIRLLASDETIIDSVAYGDWDDGSIGNNTPEPRMGLSIIRPYDDFDSNNDYDDFVLSEIVTPGSKNKVSDPQLLVTPFDEIESADEKKAKSVEEKGNTEKAEKQQTSTVQKEKPVLKVKITGDKVVDFGEPAIFDASETVSVGDVTYVWDMGDGATQEGESVDHVYQNFGYFVVTLTVTDSTARRLKKLKIQVKEPIEKKKASATIAKGESDKKVSTAGPQKMVDKSVFVPISALPSVKSNTTVSVTGIIAAEPYSYGKKKEFYLVDEVGKNSGVRVLFKKETPPVIRGDKITVTGKYTVKKDESYINLDDPNFLVVLRHDAEPLPQTEKIRGLVQLAGGLVKINGEITESKKDYAQIDDATGELKINGLKKQKISLRDQVDVTGILLKSKDGLELHPRDAGDIIVKQTTSTLTETEKKHDGFVLPKTNYIAWYVLVVVSAAAAVGKLILKRNRKEINIATLE